MFRWAKSSFKSKRKGESSKKEKQSQAVEKKKSRNVFMACVKAETLEPPYEKSANNTPDLKKNRGSKDSENCSLRKRSSGSHATAARTQSLLLPNDHDVSSVSVTRGKSDTKSMSELRSADSNQNVNEVRANSSIEKIMEISEVEVNESVISEKTKPCASEATMNNCNGLKNDPQKHDADKGKPLHASKSPELTKISNDPTKATLRSSTNEVDGNVGGDMHIRRPGKGGCEAPPPNEVTGKSRVGSVTKDDLPCDRLQSSVCGGQDSEDSGGRSAPRTELSPPSGDQKLLSSPSKNSQVAVEVEQSSVTIEKSLRTSVNSSSSTPKEPVSRGLFSSTPAADSDASASKNDSQKFIVTEITHNRKAPRNAEEQREKNADALSTVLPDILSKIESNIIASTDAAVLSDKTVLYKESDHDGKVTYEIGGASGKEINVTFSEDFNKGGELEEVVEKPIVKKHFVPLTTDDACKVDSDLNAQKESFAKANNSPRGEKIPVLDRIAADIVDSKVVTAPLSKKVLSVSKSKDGSIIREVGGTSGKEVDITILSAISDGKGEKAAVDEEIIVKEHFSPLGPENNLALDNLAFREKSVIESAVKRRFGKYAVKPPGQEGSEPISFLSQSEKELIAADLKEDLDPLWSELDNSLASAIASAGKETKASPQSSPARDEVTYQEPVNHVRRSPKDAFDNGPTLQPLQGSGAQVLRALDSLKKVSSENAEKSSSVHKFSSVSAQTLTKQHSLPQLSSVSYTVSGKNNPPPIVRANSTQEPKFSNKGHCSANSKPLVVSTLSSSVYSVANSNTASCGKAPLSPSTSTCNPSTSRTSTQSPTTSSAAPTVDPATAVSPSSPTCDCDMYGQLTRTGRHRDKCVRFSSLDFSPHGRSVGCYPIKEEPTSPLRTAVVPKPHLPKVLNKESELRATLAEEEEFDDIEIADERCSPSLDAHVKKNSAEPEASGVHKSPTGLSAGVGRRPRGERNGIVANIIGTFESSPLQGGSVDGGALRSSKNTTPPRQRDELRSLREHSKVTYTFSKGYDVANEFKTETKRETSPKPDKPVKDYKWIKPVENKEKKEVSPKSEKIQFHHRWIKPVEKIEKQTTVCPEEKSQKIKNAAVQEIPASETKTYVQKNKEEEQECSAPIQITVTEASPEKKTTIVENSDQDLLASAVADISDSKTTENVEEDGENVETTNDTETRSTEQRQDESSNTDQKDVFTEIEDNSKIESSATDAKPPDICTEVLNSGDDTCEAVVISTSCATPELDSPGVPPEPLPSSEAAITDVDENENTPSEKTREELQKSSELIAKSDSPAKIESKLPNGSASDEKVVLVDSSCLSEPSEGRESDEKKTSPPGTEPEAEVKPPTVVQPSTEFYLNPCKELLASSLSKTEAKTLEKKSLNPFGDSEDESEETITVILSASKSPVRSPTKSLNPFDEEDEEENDEYDINGESPLAGGDSLRTSTPSPLPRTTVPPVPTPRASKQGIGGSNLSLHSLDPRNLPENWPYPLKSPLNVSTLSTKSLNPFDESEEEDDSRGSFQRHHMSNLSVRGDMKVNKIERGKLRGSLPVRRKKRRAPLPPGMQAPSPSPAHGPLTSSPSTPVGLFRSATSSLRQSPIYESHRNGSLDRSAVREAQKNKNLHESPVFGGRKNLSGIHSNPPSTSTNGLGIPTTGFRRSTWGSSPRKVPPPRPPPPSPSAFKNNE